MPSLSFLSVELLGRWPNILLAQTLMCTLLVHETLGRWPNILSLTSQQFGPWIFAKGLIGSRRQPDDVHPSPAAVSRWRLQTFAARARTPATDRGPGSWVQGRGCAVERRWPWPYYGPWMTAYGAPRPAGGSHARFVSLCRLALNFFITSIILIEPLNTLYIMNSKLRIGLD